MWSSKEILKYIFRNELPVKYLIKKGLVIGEKCKIMRDVIIDPGHCWLVEIGNCVTIAPRVIILAHDASTCNDLGFAKIGNVMIGDNVFLGAGSIVLPGVRIGTNVIVGAGCVVSYDIPDNSIVVGNPMKVLCEYDQYIAKNKDRINELNTFGEEFTLRGNISNDMKQVQKKILEESCFGFVK